MFLLLVIAFCCFIVVCECLCMYVVGVLGRFAMFVRVFCLSTVFMYLCMFIFCLHYLALF